MLRMVPILPIGLSGHSEVSMPNFFVPLLAADEQEQAYQQLAKSVGATPQADPERRIYSMVWKHDLVEWTATVGEELRGIGTKKTGRGRTAKTREVPRGTSDVVLAIFSGSPFMIVHNDKSRVWNVPIYAGDPTRIVYFGS